MSTTLKFENLVQQKYIKRVVSSSGGPADTGNISAEAVALLSAATWTETDYTGNGLIPSRGLDSSDLSGAQDAFQASGDVNVEAVTQKSLDGAALYRITLPTGAAASPLLNIQFSATTCRYTENGGKIEVWRSAVDTPSALWNITGSGETTSLINTEIGKPATYPGAAHITTDVVFEPVVDFSTGDYLWVLVTLDTYGGNRGFWIEGAIATALSTIEIIVTADFTPVVVSPSFATDPLGTPSYTSDTTPNIRYGAFSTANQYFRHLNIAATKYSLSAWTGINEAFSESKTQYSGGHTGTGGFSITTVIDLTSTPKTIDVGRLGVWIEVPFAEVSGLNLYLFPSCDQLGETAIRFFVISNYDFSADMESADIRTNWDKAETNLPKSFYDGTNEFFIGTKSVKNHKYLNNPIVIPLTKNILSDVVTSTAYGIKIGMIFEHLDSRDVELPVIGFSGAFLDVAYVASQSPNS
jgi:hypothetical protein